MGAILETIVEKTREDLSRRKREITASDLETMACYEQPRKGFRNALKTDGVSVIAEIKKASPSRGVIRPDFDPLKLAESYWKGGASALSVLTDTPFFQGSLTYLENISIEMGIPLLRKDFIIDPYQVKEARAHGADAVLLIAAITSGRQLEELLAAAREYELDALVECYSREEVKQMDWNRVDLFGVNNRDLRTFEVDLHRGITLLEQAPEQVVTVSESGLSSAEDLLLLTRHGIDAALIGEYFMRQKNPGEVLRNMLYSVRKSSVLSGNNENGDT
ncbi:MAG: indole-3-glycerol phosphate synthase TrpC [Balneolaceae bacterium]